MLKNEGCDQGISNKYTSTCRASLGSWDALVNGLSRIDKRWSCRLLPTDKCSLWDYFNSKSTSPLCWLSLFSRTAAERTLASGLFSNTYQHDVVLDISIKTAIQRWSQRESCLRESPESPHNIVSYSSVPTTPWLVLYYYRRLYRLEYLVSAWAITIGG